MSGLGGEQHGWRTLVMVCIGYAMVVVDTTAVNVALPALGTDLSASSSGLQWVIDGYVLVFAGLLISGGAVGDRLGSDRAFVVGVVGFAAASVACAVAPSITMLIVARAAQGVGAALLAPSAVSLISQAFPNAKQRARATAVFVTAAGSPQALGPVLGGALIGGFGWRSVFWINVPLALVTLALTRGGLPHGVRGGARIGPVGQISVMVAAVGFITVVIEAPHGESAWPVLTAAALACAAATAVLHRIQHRSQHPPFPPALARITGWVPAVLLGTLIFAAYYGSTFVITQLFQNDLHLTTIMTGVAFLPAAIPILALPLLSAPLVERFDARRLIGAGLIFSLLGAAVLATPWSHDLLAVEVGLLMMGTGVGLIVAPQISLVMLEVPPEWGNTASGILNAARQGGTALGVAMIGAVYTLAPVRGIQFAALTVAAFTIAAVILHRRSPKPPTPSSHR